jgi:hypothetical protein
MNGEMPPRWWSWTSFRPLFRGIGQRLLLVGPIVLIALIAVGRLGGYFGLPELFWHQNWLKQALAGLAVGLMFAEICLVGFLLDAPKPWLQELPLDAGDGWHRGLSRFLDNVLRLLVPQPAGRPEEVRQWRQLRWYVSVTWLPLLVFLAALILVDPAQRWGFLPGLAAALIVVGLFVRAFQALNAGRLHHDLQQSLAKLPAPPVTGAILAAAFVGLLLVAALVPAARLVVILLLGGWLGFTGAYAAGVRYRDVAPEQRWVHGLAAAGFTLFFVVYNVVFLITLLSPVWAAVLVPPAVALCLLLTVVVAGHGFLKFHFGGWYTLLAFAVFGLAVGIAGFTGYRHQLRELDYSTDALFDLEGADFQMEAVDTGSEADRLKRLRESYARLYKRYQNNVKLLGPVDVKVPDQPKGKTPDDVQAEQRELRKAMLALERNRLGYWKKGALLRLGIKPKMIVVSVSGGANRSAVWTAYTLAKLERELRDEQSGRLIFPNNVRLITGASGGMVGAAYYTATLKGAAGHGFKTDADAETFVRKVGQDALTPVSHRLLFLDLPGVFVPGGTFNDRGLALEQAWQEYLDSTLEQSFADLAKGEAEGWRPSLVLSPMIVEDGRRMLFSNLYLSPLAETTGNLLSLETTPPDTAKANAPGQKRPVGRFEDVPRYSLTALEFFQMFPDTWSMFKLSTAVRLNASFPYVSPVAALPTNPPRHLVDAGYYDNYGVNLATWWIFHNREWLAENTSGVVVIQIRDAISERQRLTPEVPPAQRKIWDLDQGVEGLLGPAIGASHAMQSMMSFRNDEQLQVLHDWFNVQRQGKPPFTTVVFECPADIAMSWYLSDREIAEAMSGFEALSVNDRALTRLREWFRQ